MGGQVQMMGVLMSYVFAVLGRCFHVTSQKRDVMKVTGGRMSAIAVGCIMHRDGVKANKKMVHRQ